MANPRRNSTPADVQPTRKVRQLPTPGAIFFDLDGTLVDTVGTRIDAWLEVFERFQLPAEREQIAPLIGVDGKRLASEVAAAAGRPIDPAGAEEIDRVCGEIFQRRNQAPRPLPGIRELVDAIESQGITWSIATSSRREQVATSIRALDLPAEPMIVDGSHVEHAKPEPDLLLLAAKQIGLDPGRCWYVGDATWDMVSAVAAGMIAIGVTAGSAVSAEALRGAGAALVFSNLDGVTAALRSR
jgi:HAD superfamily hydrolase (TIGR01509 family)